MSFVFDKIKKFFSTALVTYALAGLLLMMISNPQEAVSDRLNQLSSFGDYPSLLESGKASYDERLLRIAIRYYKLVARLMKNSDGPYAMIGYCYARIGENDRAIRYYQKALQLAPQRMWYNYDLGILYLRKHETNLSLGCFQKVIDQDQQAALQSGILSALGKLPYPERQYYFAQAASFIMQVHSQAMAMISNPDPKEHIVMHPWANSIQPGKELYLW